MIAPTYRPLLRSGAVALSGAQHMLASAPQLPVAVADDGLTVFALLAVAGASGHAMGKTPVGKALSGPVCAMAFMFALAASGVLPPATPVVSLAQITCVRLATPLLLFSADLRAVGRRAGRLLPSFLLGTAGTMTGALLAYRVMRAPLLAAFGADAAKACAALAAKNVGGGLNFVAVAAALQLSPVAFAAALAIDNVMALIYFPACAWLGRRERDPCDERDDDCEIPVNGPRESSVAVAPATTTTEASRRDQRVGAQSAALATALCIAAASRAMAAQMGAAGFDLPLATMLAVGGATVAPRLLGSLSGVATELGTVCIFLFFASAGWTGGALGSALLAGAHAPPPHPGRTPGCPQPSRAHAPPPHPGRTPGCPQPSRAHAPPPHPGRTPGCPQPSRAPEAQPACSLSARSAGATGSTAHALPPHAVVAGGPPLLGFLTILYATHLSVVIGLGTAARGALATTRWGAELAMRCLTLPQLLIASNANIGGPATASALAMGSRWPSLISPSLLVGNAGYAIATPLAILLYALIR